MLILMPLRRRRLAAIFAGAAILPYVSLRCFLLALCLLSCCCFAATMLRLFLMPFIFTFLSIAAMMPRC